MYGCLIGFQVGWSRRHDVIIGMAAYDNLCFWLLVSGHNRRWLIDSFYVSLPRVLGFFVMGRETDGVGSDSGSRGHLVFSGRCL